MDYINEARHHLQWERESAKRIPATPVSLVWRGQTYLAVIYEVKSLYTNEIIQLQILSPPLVGDVEGLLRAISELDKNRLKLNADHDFNLEGRLHVLRRIGSVLTKLEPEQIDYLKKINFTVIDSDTGQVHKLEHHYSYEDPQDMDPSIN